MIKRAEYADAGIDRYWMIDLENGPSLTACRPGGEFGYADAETATGVFETEVPFPVSVDLPQLTR